MAKKTMHTKSGRIDKRKDPTSKFIRKTMGKKRKSKKKDGCFVSTVCFGESSIETQIFRNWRDNYLIDRYLGKRFVSWYYHNGEKLSQTIDRFKIVRVFVSYLLSKFARFLGKWYR